MIWTTVKIKSICITDTWFIIIVVFVYVKLIIGKDTSAIFTENIKCLFEEIPW